MTKKKIEESTVAIETIKKELIENFNTEIKEDLIKEIDNHINNQVKISINNELEKTNKKILKSKNRRLFIKNIIIILLLTIIIYLLYLLKEANYFDKYFINNNNNYIGVKEHPKEEVTANEQEELSLEDLKKEYAYLLDSLYLNESSSYINTLYEGNLTKEIKQYFIVNKLSKEELTSEDNYNIIDNRYFKNTYEKLFNDEYEPKNFEYNDNNIRYITKIDSYITNNLITDKSTNIIKEIINIEVNKDKIEITTIEGLKRENKIFNIITKEEVCEDKDIKENIDKLNKLIYTFDKDNKLINITK